MMAFAMLCGRLPVSGGRSCYPLASSKEALAAVPRVRQLPRSCSIRASAMVPYEPCFRESDEEMGRMCRKT